MAKYLKSSRHISTDPEKFRSIKDETHILKEETFESADMLRTLRVQKGMSSKELGDQIGLSASEIAKMEEGELPISDEVAEELGVLFKVDPKAFLI